MSNEILKLICKYNKTNLRFSLSSYIKTKKIEFISHSSKSTLTNDKERKDGDRLKEKRSKFTCRETIENFSTRTT